MMQTKIYLIVLILSTLAVEGIFAKPTIITGSKCPPDQPEVNCLLDPCSVSSCPEDPTAACFSNYCGGCNAVWLGANGAPAQCDKNSECAPGQEEVECFRDPCQGETCPAYSDAVCVANYCGGCNFAWYTSNGEQVECYIIS